MTGTKTIVSCFIAVLAVLATGLFMFGHKDQHGEGAMLPAREAGGFQDISVAAGIRFRMNFLPGEQGKYFKTNLYDHGSGVVVADFDNDGFEDIYLLNQLGPNAMFRNMGDGSFRDMTEQAGVALEDRVCVGAACGDYDRDGDQDLYVTSTRGGNVLFQNQGHGRFRDVTAQAGLELVAHSQTAAFVDFDGDGYLDLYVTNTAHWTEDSYDKISQYYPGVGWDQLFASRKEYNNFYHNNQDGTFSDIAGQASLSGKGWGGDVCVLDYDNDGDLDLLVTNMFGQSQLYRNDGQSRFTEVTSETLKRSSFGAIGSRCFDFNNDGLLDIYISDMHSDMWMDPYLEVDKVAWINQHHDTKYPTLTGPMSQFDPSYDSLEQEWADLFHVEYDKVLFGNTMFKNLGSGHFEEVSDQSGLETFWPWGIAAGDFDNDGWIDIFLPSGMGYPYWPWRNYLLINNGDETFRDESESSGIHPPLEGITFKETIDQRPVSRSSRCAATADFDKDGRLDLIVNNFNDRPYYYRNTYPRQNFVAFQLTGTRSNPDAIGATVTLRLGQEVMVRQVHPAGGYLSQSSKILHFGLGKRGKIDAAVIRWPSGTVQTISQPAMNEFHEIREPDNPGL